jgi:hypothetical protein
VTKTEQNRVLARRLKVLRKAALRPGTRPRPAVISAYHVADGLYRLAFAKYVALDKFSERRVHARRPGSIVIT